MPVKQIKSSLPYTHKKSIVYQKTTLKFFYDMMFTLLDADSLSSVCFEMISDYRFLLYDIPLCTVQTEKKKVTHHIAAFVYGFRIAIQ